MSSKNIPNCILSYNEEMHPYHLIFYSSYRITGYKYDISFLVEHDKYRKIKLHNSRLVDIHGADHIIKDDGLLTCIYNGMKLPSLYYELGILTCTDHKYAIRYIAAIKITVCKTGRDHYIEIYRSCTDYNKKFEDIIDNKVNRKIINTSGISAYVVREAFSDVNKSIADTMNYIYQSYSSLFMFAPHRYRDRNLLMAITTSTFYANHFRKHVKYGIFPALKFENYGVPSPYQLFYFANKADEIIYRRFVKTEFEVFNWVAEFCENTINISNDIKIFMYHVLKHFDLLTSKQLIKLNRCIKRNKFTLQLIDDLMKIRRKK